MANEKQLVIEVRDKVATFKSKNFNLVGGNNDYDVVFDFDKDWEKHHTKTAIFVFGREKPVCKVFGGNVCEGIAIYNATTCLIGVVAGDVSTTTSAVVDCVYRSIVDEAGETPEPPTEDVYNQIIELLNKYIQQGGYVGEEDIIRVIEKYLEENPIKDGFSPTVSVEDIGNGHRVVITDESGDHSFDLLNGANGLTPFIGENGNWWIGEEDTGAKASSEIIDEVLASISLSVEHNEYGTFSIELSQPFEKDITLLLLQAFETPEHQFESDFEITIPAGETKYYGELRPEGDIIGEPHLVFSYDYYPDDGNFERVDGYTLTYRGTKFEADIILMGGELVATKSELQEVESIAKGAQKALTHSNYSQMIAWFNGAYSNTPSYRLNVGQNIMIVTLNVPDLWVSGYTSDYNKYAYTTDEAFVEELMANGSVHIGNYKVSALETQKVNLADYYDKGEIDGMIGDISTALDTLHNYAQSLVSGGKS